MWITAFVTNTAGLATNLFVLSFLDRQEHPYYWGSLLGFDVLCSVNLLHAAHKMNVEEDSWKS